MVAGIICDSIRAWYAAVGKPGRFPGGPESCLLFPEVYEALDPGCCMVAEDPTNGRIAAACFYHPRPTHVSLGIMAAHPDYFGQGAAKAVLQSICDIADQQGKPIRLVSSAMNLDSFSLYTRAGFTARAVFQDMTLNVPLEGLPFTCEGSAGVRAAVPDDVPAMMALEWEAAHIRREQDWRYMVENRAGIWHVSVIEDESGISGFLASIHRPASNMLGPGVMRTDAEAAALVLAELNAQRGRSPVFLVPTHRGALVRQLYAWGARNCELSLLQVRGHAEPIKGVVIPTFMPETG